LILTSDISNARLTAPAELQLRDGTVQNFQCHLQSGDGSIPRIDGQFFGMPMDFASRSTLWLPVETSPNALFLTWLLQGRVKRASV